jgi:hypothetical protein
MKIAPFILAVLLAVSVTACQTAGGNSYSSPPARSGGGGGHP